MVYSIYLTKFYENAYNRTLIHYSNPQSTLLSSRILLYSLSTAVSEIIDLTELIPELLLILGS